ncbi:MAG: right-handed parallel beta-helix repeat-containing protein, partial [Phycisphaeraceae bacterium JB051]
DFFGYPTMNLFSRLFVFNVFALCLTVVLPSRAADVAVLQQVINQAIAQGQSKVTLPAGRYEVSDQALIILNAKHLTVDGSQTTIIGTNVNVPMLKIQLSEQVTVRGLTLDMDPLPFTQATITKVSEDGQQLHFQIHDGYPRFTGDYVVKRFHVYEKDQVRLKPGVPDVYLSSVKALTDATGVAMSGVPLNKQVAVGDRVAFNIRRRSGIELNKTDTIILDGITIYTTAGLGFSSRFTRGQNQIINCKITPGPTPAGATQPRLMSTSADGLNFAYMRHGPIVRNNEFSHMGDDAINFHGVTFPIFKQVSSTEILVGRPYGQENFDWLIEPGDEVRLLADKNFAILADCKIKTFGYDGPADEEQLAWARRTWSHGGHKASMYRITLTEPIDHVEAVYVDIPETSARKYEISNNYFHDHRARGVRIMSGDGVITNNRFERLKAVGISVGPEYAFWREAGWADNVTISNNTLIDVGHGTNTYDANSYTLGAISVFFRSEDPTLPMPMHNTNLRITNNTITRTPLAGIFIRCAQDVTVTGNQLKDVLPQPLPGAGRKQGYQVNTPIDVDHALYVTVKNNTIH